MVPVQRVPDPANPGSPVPGPDPAFEYRVVTLGRETSRSDVRRLLTEHAEYGRWELARVVLYQGGARRVWLRRKIIRVARTA
ncbi:DUF5703 family protein [Kineococcus gynurae]|uniref:DUF5703 family protein n=1 Tax=Kineococcus gynurae TaxID=452979 RepID=A0ABV5LQW0_9ACTN